MKPVQISHVRRRCLPTEILLRLIYFVLVYLSASVAFSATLTHRYSFDTDANDTIGSADGVLQGNAYITNGSLVLDGTNSSVQLPNDLFTNYDSVSFELWFANGALTSPNAQLYTFGGTNGIMTYTLNGQGFYVQGASTNVATNVVSLPAPAVAGTVHLVWTQDSSSQTACLYVNGILAAENTNFAFTPAFIGSTINDCIGGIGFVSTAANFHGNMLEFRVYQGALTPLEAAIADALGPDQAQLDPGVVQGVRLIPPPPAGPGALFRLGVYADFASVTNVNISTQPDLVLSSDNTNVLVVAPDQRLLTVGFGTADITASFQGLSNTLALTVVVPQDIALIHRYSFNEQTNDWIVHDSVSDADGQLVGNPIDISFTGNGELNMIGYPSGIGAYVALPAGLISDLSEVSIEAWVTWTGAVALGGRGQWQRIFDFGSQNIITGQGLTYLFLTPAGNHTSPGWLLHTTITTNTIVNELRGLAWTNFLPYNVTSFVAVTYSPVRGVMKMYLNGALVSLGPAPLGLCGIVDTNDWLGRSQFSLDPFFSGRYDEFRIYRGLLSDADVAAEYADGPDMVGVDYVLHDYPSSNSLTITWGTTATNWFLESSPLLGSGAVWTPVPTNGPTAPALQNGRYQVTVPISGDTSYFRLHAPP